MDLSRDLIIRSISGSPMNINMTMTHYSIILSNSRNQKSLSTQISWPPMTAQIFIIIVARTCFTIKNTRIET